MKKKSKKSNAGRKPVPDKKVQVSLYIPNSQADFQNSVNVPLA
jgi:hypothetical protein